jgi:hypothetical protein
MGGGAMMGMMTAEHLGHTPWWFQLGITILLLPVFCMMVYMAVCNPKQSEQTN